MELKHIMMMKHSRTIIKGGEKQRDLQKQLLTKMKKIIYQKGGE
jgi:hypothetical protein